MSARLIACAPDQESDVRLLRLLPALLLLTALAAALAGGVSQDLSWQALAGRQEALHRLVALRPLASAAAYVAGYAAVVALSLPVALFATLAGGLLFGPVLGPILTVLGATAGASVVFAVVRLALPPGLAARTAGLADRLRRDGLSYMLALRLMPVVPFWLVNIAAGLSGLPWRVFALGTFLGIIPASIIYGGVGAGLGQVVASGADPDLRTLTRPGVLLPLLGLAALSLLPVAWRAWKDRHGAA